MKLSKISKGSLSRGAARIAGKLRPKTPPECYKPKGTYTIVTAAFNVEAYLDDYFRSIVEQTMDKKALRVIVVDDGSTDDTVEIVKRWKDRYPTLIDYASQSHAGLYEARNRGLSLASTEWVTFVDADDYLSKDYFECVDRSFEEHPDAMLLMCNSAIYLEKKDEYRDVKPLRKGLGKGGKFYSYDCAELPIVESATAVFFRVEEMRRQGISFGDGLRSTFEDAFFSNEYLLGLTEGEIGFLTKPVYYRRRRGSGDSFERSAWAAQEALVSRPRSGYLELLRHAYETRGFVPAGVQRAVLYDVASYLRHFVGHPERALPIASSEIEGVRCSFREMSPYFDDDVLLETSGDVINFNSKVAFFSGLLGRPLASQRALLRRIDLENRVLHFRVFDGGIICLLDGQEQSPIEKKRTERTFLGDRLYDTYEVYFQFDDLSQVLDLQWGVGETAEVYVNGKLFKRPSTIEKLVERFAKDWDGYEHEDVWVFMDRDIQADDNAEHLYRYMMKNHPEQKCSFVLLPSSRDWDRLRREGFNLVEYGSPACDELFRRASKIVSSQISPFVASYFGDYYRYSKKFAFLQHGVIRSDLSNWLNSRPDINLMLTTTVAERDSIVADGSPYELTAREVILTGQPRHDLLLRKATQADGEEPSMLVMPTWRRWICDPVIGDSDNVVLNKDFLVSDYRRYWEAFLKSDYVRHLAANPMRIVFYPHPNVLPYIQSGWFEVPDWVEVGEAKNGKSIQDFIAQSSIFITDYSSTLFEAAYVEKPSIYYQFDKDEFFSGTHTSSLGYFDDERDGFGRVVFDQEGLELAIQEIVDNNFQPLDLYRERMKNAFPWRDGGCCERAYEAIKAL